MFGKILVFHMKISETMKYAVNTLFWLALMSFVFAGCREQGCTDPDAVNYSADAGRDDGSCEFEGDLVFWFDEPYSNFIQSLNVTQLRFFVADDFVGSLDAWSFVEAQPTCGDSGALTVTLEMDDVKNRNFLYRVESQTGAFLTEGLQAVRANTCSVRRID